MLKRKVELVGFKMEGKFEPLFSLFKELLETSGEVNYPGIFTLEISPMGDNVCYDEKHYNDCIMHIVQNQLNNIYIERYIRINQNKQFFIGFRIANETFDRSFGKQWLVQKNKQLMKSFSNRNIANEHFSYYEVRLKNVFDYKYDKGKRERVIVSDKHLKDVLVKFLNFKFYSEFNELVNFFFKMRAN